MIELYINHADKGSEELELMLKESCIYYYSVLTFGPTTICINDYKICEVVKIKEIIQDLIRCKELKKIIQNIFER